jgi:hypothetical protein
MSDEYDVRQYTEEQLLSILNLNNPSDRELEAKIISMIRKYQNFGNESGDKLTKFFEDIYDFFFEDRDDQDEIQEGFETIQNPKDVGLEPATTKEHPAVESVKPGAENLQLTRPLEYSKDALNPLLKQTIKRVISIDSQYRTQNTITSATNFTFNLSEPLKDVVSLSLYSIQIPYTWYTINSDFGGNFFYLKGTSPGINNGNHDYKISIPSGNYTPTDLGIAVNAGIKNVIINNTDVSFGNTQIIYNNGLSSSSGTGKCALQVDITKIFNEGNYSLQFPVWSSPIIAPSGENVVKRSTLAGYFGFNHQQYYCSSIYSNFILEQTTDDAIVFPISTRISGFQIIPYVGSSYLLAETTYTPIAIDLNVEYGYQVYRNTLVDSLNQILLNNSKLDPNPHFTGCSWINITNPLQVGYGDSYVQLKCKLNKSSAPIVKNLKLAAIFRVDPSGSIFYGPNSIFNFSTKTTDASGNVICEFNEVIAETPILQTNYTASGDSITFDCIAGEKYFENALNNYIVDIPAGVYTLYSYVAAANKAIQNHPSNFYSVGGSLTNVTLDTNGYITIQSSINNSFTNKNYKISASGSAIQQMFGLTSTPVSIESNITNSAYRFLSFITNPGYKITITPASEFGNSGAAPFEIAFTEYISTDDGSEVASMLQTTIVNYVDDVTHLKPFMGSTVQYNVETATFNLIMNVNVNLTQRFYKLGLKSTNFWSTFGFDSSYDLVDFSNNQYVVSSFPVKVGGNQITIYDGSNDTFSISVDDSVDGLQTSNNAYNINITIPDTTSNGTGTAYSMQDLINIVNVQLTQNDISKGSLMELISSNGKNYVKFRFNINKVFTTKDYSLVFYDPYSFTTCHSASKNGSNTSQNATWDSTLGWILGYRNQIEYSMAMYSETYSSIGASPPDIFYFSDYPNVFVIYGDTAVSTNLYNYFLIMLDDYVQNHLNDGLVTITAQETSNDPGPHIYICDPTTGQKIAVPANYGSPGVTYTQKELNSFNQKVRSQITKLNSYSSGPFVQDIFGIVPVKTSGMPIGSVYVEFGGTLQLQQRVYFGPVNIHRMTIRLLNDRGNTVDLNGANWSFSLVCEQLYKNGVS